MVIVMQGVVLLVVTTFAPGPLPVSQSISQLNTYEACEREGAQRVAEAKRELKDRGFAWYRCGPWPNGTLTWG